MKITARYFVDQNFLTICADGVIHTFARRGGDYGSRDMRSCMESYWKNLTMCDRIGTFELGYEGDLIRWSEVA